MLRSRTNDTALSRPAEPGEIVLSDDARLDSALDEIQIEIDVATIEAEVAVVQEARRRLRDKARGNDRRSGLITGGSFLVAVAVWNVLSPPRAFSIGTLAACVAVYVVAASVEFEIGPGSALPTTPVQVLMLFLLPPQLVPVAVLCGLGGAAVVGRLLDPERRERPLVLSGSGWQVIGPAAVFAIAHVRRPALAHIGVYVLALAAQFVLDATSSWVRNCYGLRVPTKELSAALTFTFGCDLLLAPLGLAAALAWPGSVGGLLFLLPLTALLAMLQADRRKQIDKTIALGAAFADTRDLARRDPLTGLSNRLAWEEALARFEELDSPIGVVLADVDGLKIANDRYGHDVGDRLLVAVADVIAAAAARSPGAVAARIGGDEFALLLPRASSMSTFAVSSTLLAAFTNPPSIDGEVPVSASVGAGYAESGRTLGPAIGTADRRVNVNKESRGMRRS
jgi:diguanylate cyclase (GGDEF)-like protein